MFENPVAAIIFWSLFGGILLFIAGFVFFQFRHLIFGGYMRVNFTGEDRRTGGVIIKADESDHDFEIMMFGKNFKYGLDRKRIYRNGRFNLPTAYYKIGDAVPIDMLKTGEESDIAALDYAQVARNTVTRDLLAAFVPSFLSPQNIFLITIAAVAASALILGVFMNQKFGDIEELILPSTNTGSSPNTGTPGGLLE